MFSKESGWRGRVLVKGLRLLTSSHLNWVISFPDKLCNYSNHSHSGILCNEILGCEPRSWVVCNDKHECDHGFDEDTLLFDCGRNVIIFEATIVDQSFFSQNIGNSLESSEIIVSIAKMELILILG